MPPGCSARDGPAPVHRLNSWGGERNVPNNLTPESRFLKIYESVHASPLLVDPDESDIQLRSRRDVGLAAGVIVERPAR